MSVSMRGSERANSGRTSNKSLRGRVALAAAVSLTASGVWTACAEAARGGNDVKGAQVLAGAAQISNKGSTTTIRAIDKTIIKYDRFNIPKNGTVRFIQPSSSSRVLNRIDSATPSRIEGHFTANGIVFFVNPAGVMFGPTAVVDVGRLYAGAGSIGDQDFLGGINKFSTASGSVVNQGRISGEQVHLFGSQVVNRGAIVADGGIVTMSSGKDVFIGEEGGNIMVKVEGAASKGGAGVVNSGSVNAGKGVVRMTGAGDIYSIAVNTSGFIKAKDVAIDAGKGAAVVGGKIDASDPSAGAVGGKVTVTGGKVALIGAKVDASGAAGGGTVLVGGDVHGGGSTPTATGTLVDATSTIKADAIESGNGGKVVVWSDKLTAFGGNISAKGGATAGDGGFSEVSGKEKLIYKGKVDVTAAHGAAGTLLLDPDSITIQAANPDIAGDGTNLDIANVGDLDDAINDFGGKASIITNGQLSTLLNGNSNVILQATNFITLAAGAAVTGNGTADLTLDTPVVNLSSPITLSGGGVLKGVGANTVNVFSGGLIQNGVDVVANAGTVNVGAGTFGGFTVNKSISVLGANDTKTGFDGTRGAESVVNGQVVLNQPNTTFKGFTVTGVTSGAGIVASNAQGDLIANNIIADNVFGMSLASNGSAAATVAGNLFDTNTRAGGASGNGIYTDFTVSNVVVNNNHFTGNTEGSVSFFGSAANPQSNVEISDNVMTDDGPISLETINNVSITRNTISNADAHAIWIAGGVSNVTIANNFLENNGGAGVKFADQNIDPAPASNVTITDNVISGNADGGIVINSGRYTGPLDATGNFWGSANGPIDAGTPTDHGNTFNIGTQGDAIVNPGGVTVNYVKWLTSGADQTPGTAGFQPDAGSLFAPISVGGNFFANIQAANNFATAGNTVSLAGGTYTENVTTKSLTLQFSGDGTLASGGSLLLTGGLNIVGDASITIGATVNVGANTLVVDTQGASGTSINITGPINASSGGTVSIQGQQTVTIGGSINTPGTLTLSSLDDVVVNAAVAAVNQIIVSAGEDGIGGFTIGAGGSLTQSGLGATRDITITTGTTSGNVVLGGTVSGTGLVSITTAGTVTQTAGISTALLGINSVGSVTLNSANAVGTLGVNVSGLNNTLSYTSAGPVTIGTAGTVSGVTTNAGNVLLNTGGLTITQPVSASGATVRVVASGPVAQSGTGTITAAALGVRTTGSAAVTLNLANPTSTFAANTANSNVTYVSSGPLTVGSVGGSGAFAATNGINAGNASITLKGGTSVDVNQPITTTGIVRIVANNGTVNQTAAGTITANQLGVRANDDVTLTAAPNNVGTFAASTSGAGNVVSYTDADLATIGTVLTEGTGIFTTTNGVSAAGPVTVTAGGVLAVNDNVTGTAVTLAGAGVTQNGTSIVDAGSGLLTVNGGAGAINMTGTLTTTNATASAVSVLNGTSVLLPTVSAANGGLTVSGSTISVAQNAGKTITSGNVTVSSAGSVNLGNANSIGTVLGATSSGGLTINDTSGGLIVSGPLTNGAADAISITTAGGPLAIQTDITGGAVQLNGAGITQTTGSDISATTLRLNSSSAVTLGNTGNNVGTLAASVSGNLSFTNGGGFTIGTASGLNGINIGANALSLTAGGDILQTQTITSGAATFHTTSGGVNLQADNVVTGTVRFTTDGVGNVGFNNTVATDIGASSVGGQLGVFSQGPITDSGTIIVGLDANFTTLNNAGAAITLDEPGSAFLGLRVRSRDLLNTVNAGGAITVSMTGMMDLFAAASNGTITLTADKIELEAPNSVEGTGALILQPRLANANINLGTNGAGFSFSDIDLDALKPGFSSITIGQGNGTGIVTVSANANFENSVSITGGSFVGAGTLASNGAANMTLHATTGGIGTLVTPLNVSVAGTLSATTDGAGAAGDIFLASSGPLSLGGNITTDGGSAQAVNVSANGITITSSNGGSSNDNLTLTSAAAFTINNVNLSGNTISVTAAGNITDTGTGTITTSGAGGLTLTSSAGGIGVSVANPLGVSVGGTGVLTLGSLVTPTAGNVFVTSAGALTLGAVNTGAAVQTIDVRTTSGNLKLNNSVSGNDNWVLNSAGNINNAGTTLTAASVDADAVTGIGSAGVFGVSTPIISANSSTSGFVNIDNTSAAAVTIGSLSTAGGSNITYSQSGGGSATLNGATTAANGNITVVNIGGAVTIGGPVSAGGSGQVQLVGTTAAGKVTINSPVSGGSADIISGGNTVVDANVTVSGLASINSAGNITGSGTVSGATANLTAVTGIGDATPLDVAAGTLTATTSGLGAAIINLTNSSGGTMTLNNVSTVGAGANITVSQTGAGNRLRLVSVSAPNGSVTLSTNETINEALNDDSGAHTAEIIANNASLIGDNGIGTTSRLDLTVGGTTSVNTVGGNVSITDSVGLTLGASSVGGDLTAVAETGNLNTTGALIIGGAGTLTAQAGGATMNIGDTVTGGTGNLTMTADGGITLSNTVDGGNTFTATANSGAIVALGDIGSITAPAAVNFNGMNIALKNVETGTGNQAYTASGLITLGGSIYRSNGGSISFNGNAALAAPVITVTSGGSIGDDISFGGTVNGPTALTLSAGAGNVSIGGAAGGNTKLISLSADGTNISLHDVATSGLQLYTGSGMITLNSDYTADAGSIVFSGNATLADDTTVTTSGGLDTDDILFAGTITGPGSLTASAAGLGDVAIAGGGGVGTPLGFASITGNDITINGMVTGGAQAYNGSGNVSLNNGTYTSGGAITASADGNLLLKGTFNSAAAQTYTGTGGLSLEGTYSANSGAISFTAPTATLSGITSVSTAGGTDADDISFSGGITGPFALTLSTGAGSAGDVVVSGDIGVGSIVATGNDIQVKNVTTATNQIFNASGTITLGGGTYGSTSGDIAFNGKTLLSADTVVSTDLGGDITFGGTLDGAHTLAVNTTSGGGITTFTGAVGGTASLISLSTDADGTTRINGGVVKTTLDQIYNDAVKLGADTIVTAGGNITFAGTVDSSGGDRNLTVNAGLSSTFGDAVGGSGVLKNLIVNATTGIAINGGEVSTVEDQTYNDDVTIGLDTILGGHDISFAEKVDGAFGLTINTNGGGTTTFTGAVGSGTALAFLSTNTDGTTAINGGSVRTSGGQAYGDAVTLGATTTLTGGSVNFTSTIDSTGGAKDLTVNSGGPTIFGGAVGATAPLKNLVTDATGSTTISAGITTTEDQTFNDAVTIGADATLSGVNVKFVETVDGANDLTVNASGNTVFTKAVGGTTPLASLTTDATGNTQINGGAVSTSGAQDYKDKVTLGADTTITATAGSATFEQTLDSSGAARALVLNVSGATTFSGDVGGTLALASLTTDAPGSTVLGTTAAVTVKTTGDQTYNDAVNLGANAVVDGKNITFASTVDGAHALAVNTNGSGTTIFGDAVGATTPLTTLTTNVDGTTQINGGVVKTSGDQTYNDTAVTLKLDTTLTGVDIKFLGTLDSDAAGSVDLTLVSSGNTTFVSAVGGVTPLKNLTTTAGGGTLINGGVVKTTEDQTYNDLVSLGGTATLTGNDIIFASTINSDVANATPRDLIVNADGTTTFGGTVGNVNPITSLTTDAAGSTHINTTSIKTSGDQTFNDVVVLGADVVLDTGTGTAPAGNVTFGKTVDSDADTSFRDLTINSKGTTTFTLAVGVTHKLDNLLTDANGSTVIKGGTVSTNLAQTYNDAVVLGAGTTLNAKGVLFAATLNSDATARDLIVNSGTGDTEFRNPVGGTAALKNLTINATGNTLLNTSGITTTEDQTYNNNVLVGGGPTLAGNDVTFGGTVNAATGAFSSALTVNSSGTGTTTFSGAVGGTAALQSLTTNADGKTIFANGTVKTSGAQSLGDDVQINQDTTFTATTTGTSITFGGDIDSNLTTVPTGGTAPKLIIRSGVITPTGTTTAVGSSDITISGKIGDNSKISAVDMQGKKISLHDVHTTNNQIYTPATLATMNGNYISDAGNFNMVGNSSVGGLSSVETTNQPITFSGTIDGNNSLDLSAGTGGAGIIKVTKAIGGSTALGGFTAAAKTIDLLSVKTKKGGDADHTGVISLKVSNGTTSEVFQDDKGQNFTAFTPTGTITLGGGLQSAGGDIVLGTTVARSADDVLTLPSIIIKPAANGTAVISGRNVTMNAGEKMTVNGSVSINGTGTVTLGDITAADSISVNAPNITLRQRKDGVVFATDGNTLLHDVNTDFVARNAINFSGNVQVEGTVDDAHRVLFATAGAQVTGAPAGTSVRALNPDLFSITRSGGQGEFIDLRAEGPSVTNPAAALAGAAPQESRQPEIENAVASSQAVELRNLGIFARDMDRASLMGYLEGIVLYNDVPGRIASGETLPREQYQVTKNRLSYDGARRVLDLYYSTYFQTDEYGRPIMKNGKRAENITAMNKAIEEAIAAYRGKTGQKTGSIDPVAFREYVETTPSQGEALKHMNRLRNLFNEILPVGQASSNKGLGLTPVEAAISRKVLVESLGVQGMEPEKLETAILTNTGRTAPAAKPMVSPAPKPVANPAPKPAVNSAPKPAANSTAKPANSTATPSANPTAKPTLPPANKAEPRPTFSPTPKIEPAPGK